MSHYLCIYFHCYAKSNNGRTSSVTCQTVRDVNVYTRKGLTTQSPRIVGDIDPT